VLAGALAGAAGVLFALRTYLVPSMGFTPGLFAFTAAVIGGIGSIPGAMLGGIRSGRHPSGATGLSLLLSPQGVASATRRVDCVSRRSAE